MKALLAALTALVLSAFLAAPSAGADAGINIKKLAERKVEALPPGELFWRVESFASLSEAQGAAGPYGLAAQSNDGKAWLFTLGSAGQPAKGKTLAELGPIAPFPAPVYLLRINEATGAPGATTPVHSHPGSEAFFVLAGEQSVRGPYGVMKLHAGEPAAGHGADVPMQVTSTGHDDMHALVMFVLDADKPFMTPARMP
jgi:quercetin dioxygenase-like cupin family protein